MSSEQQPARRSKRRRIVACQRCHRYKTKCSGGNPCTNCRDAPKSVECIYPVKDRQVPVSESYLQSLQNEVDALKAQQQVQRRATVDTQPGSDRPASTGPSITEESPHSVLDNPLVSQRPRMVQAQAGGPSSLVYLGDASGIAFGMKLQDLVSRNKDHHEPPLFRTEHRYFTHSALLRTRKVDYHLPERSYALILIRVLKRFLGDTHHLNLGPAFIRRLDGFYGTKAEDPRWICRLFLVFALGELYSNKITKDGSDGHEIPGTSFFVTAVSLLQDAFEAPNVSYVETLLLASLYSDALNRTNSAYAYVGLALRVSMTLGLHRNVTDTQMSTGEKEHRNRVWWTVYYLERLCSSKLGHPMMLRDEDISTALPTIQSVSGNDAYEFPDPSIMIAQLKLAKIVGSISRDMYVTRRPAGGSPFLHNVHAIFTSLKDWNERLPDGLKLNSTTETSRPIASLHLLFNQCVILATRPILFAVIQVRGRFRATASVGSPELPDVARTLARNCIHAAKNINQMLIQLWIDGSIAMFSYTDAIILFTSSMILMIAIVLDDQDGTGTSPRENLEKIENAWRLMASMRDCGNIAAAGFYEQTLQLKTALGLSGTMDSVTSKTALSNAGGLETQAEGDFSNGVLGPSVSLQPAPSDTTGFDSLQQFLMDSDQLPLANSGGMGSDSFGIFSQSLSNEWNGIPFSISMDDLNEFDPTAIPFLWE